MARGSNAAYKKKKSRGGDPTKAKSVLQSAFRQFGIDKQLQNYQFVLAWKEIVGPEIARRTKPECIERGTLVVRVCDSTWAHELSFRKETILERMAQHNTTEPINDIRFYVDGREY